MKDSKGRDGFNDPLKWEQVRDGQGKLVGYVSSKNYMGITTVADSKGHTLGWSKDASDAGGLPYTQKFGPAPGSAGAAHRISQGENPFLLFNQEKKEEKKPNDPPKRPKLW